MNTKIILIASTIFTLCSMQIFSQTISDARRYTTVGYNATGRAIGTNGSFSAIGADFSLIGANPAGLAVFRKSEFMFTPGVDIINSKSKFKDSSDGLNIQPKTKMSFTNLGVVVTNKPRASKWKTMNIGIGFNRIATFRKHINNQGTTENSITERWIEKANGFYPDELDDFEVGLGYDSYAIYDILDDNDQSTRRYESDYTPGYPLSKSQNINTSGGISEFSISIASNYNEKLMIGASLGFPFAKYKEDKTYIEEDPQNRLIFDKLTYTQFVNTSGSGINLKLGAIWRVSQMIRLGVAAHTGTLFNLEDEYGSSVLYEFTDPSFPIGTPTRRTSPENATFGYNFKTPWKLNGSAGFLFGKHGFVSAEVEWIDYSNSKFKFDSDNAADIEYQNELNTKISNDFKAVINTRIGGEYAIRRFRLRAGLGLIGTPNSPMPELASYSAGIGYRKRKFYIDLGYQLKNVNDNFYTYKAIKEKSSLYTLNSLSKNHIVLTLGFKM